MAKPTAPKTKTPPADAFSRLEQDHREVEGLFERLEGAKDGSARLAAFLLIKDALAKHAVLEEHIVYPAVRSCHSVEAQEAATKGYDAHEDIKGTLAEIEMSEPESGLFSAKCLQLKELVAKHVEEEERVMFPAGRRALPGRRLEDLSQRQKSLRTEQGSVEREAAPARKTSGAGTRPR